MALRHPPRILLVFSSTRVLSFVLVGFIQSHWADQAPAAADDDKQVQSAQSNPKLTMRQRALAVYDADGDGRLNATEREAIRKAGSPFAVKRPVFRRGRASRDKAWIKKHDKDGDGELNAQERRAAHAALLKIWGKLVGQYAAFENDKPVVANLKKMERDAKAGKIDGFPLELYGWIRGSIERVERKSRKSRGPRRSDNPLAKFDNDQNGVLDAQELQAIRTTIATKKQADSPKDP